ncbi:hypothetical protein Hamer_G012838 [Homarus americanus]|uniref:Uncharacterized protein n=1 Tax=Homarus americanus TaxID=6706 RepID=A0A8J5MY68_HOMAM|nr:hypothetical protein Hamer_G012838 [Homarus americanus]
MPSTSAWLSLLECMRWMIGPYVTDEVLPAGGTVGAVRTGEGLLSCMSPVVTRQQVRPLKSMATNFTRVGFVSVGRPGHHTHLPEGAQVLRTMITCSTSRG